MGRHGKHKRRKLGNNKCLNEEDLSRNNDKHSFEVAKGDVVWAELEGCPKNLLWPCMMEEDGMVYCKADDQQFSAKSLVQMSKENFEDYRRKGSDLLLKKKLKNLFLAFIYDCEWVIEILNDNLGPQKTSLVRMEKEPNNSQPCITEPDNSQSCFIEPDNGQSCSTEPDNSQSCFIEPDNSHSCSTEPDNSKPCITEPTNSQPCITVPVNNQSCFIEPDNSQSCSTEPDNSHPCITEPDNSQSCFIEPDNSQPCITEPDNSKSCFKEPDNNSQSCSTEPDNSQPCITEPANSQSCFIEPDNSHSCSTEPDNSHPCITEPDNSQSCFIEPDNSQPCITEPDNSKSCFKEPDNNSQSCFIEADNSQSCSTEPDNSQLCSIEPDNSQPCITEPDNSKSCFKEPDNNSQSCFIEPDNCQSCSTEPANSQSCFIEPDNSQSCSTEPDNSQSCITEPANSQSCSTEPNNSQLCFIEPDNSQPCITEPDNSKSCFIEPDNNSQSCSTEPDNGQSCIAEPENKQSCVTEPENKQPCVAEPDISQSYVTEPDIRQSLFVDCGNKQSSLSKPDNYRSLFVDYDNQSSVAERDSNQSPCEELDSNWSSFIELDNHQLFTEYDNQSSFKEPENYESLFIEHDNNQSSFTEHNKGSSATRYSNNNQSSVTEHNEGLSATRYSNNHQSSVTEQNMRSSATEADNNQSAATEHYKLSVTEHNKGSSTTEPDLSSVSSNSKEIQNDSGFVYPVTHRRGEKRIYDKRHCCYFCGDTFSKISEHIENKHSNEREVAKLLSKAKNGQARANEWKRIRNLGDFHYNLKVLSERKGSLIVDRRPKEKKAFEDFLPCTHCLGFYLKDELWRHSKICPLKSEQTGTSKGRVYTSSQLLLESAKLSPGIDEDFIKVVSGMKKDEVLECIKTDNSLRMLGSSMIKKVGISRIANVRQKLRELGRLLLEIRKITERTASFQDILTPQNFDTVVRGVQNITKHPEGGDECLTERGCPKYDKPTLALKLGHSLKKIAEMKRGSAIRNGNEIDRKEAENYIILHETEWSEKISSHATQSSRERSFNEPQLLPLTEDVVTLRKYLIDEQLKLGEELQQNPSLTLWRKLAMCVLSRVTIFNKRRGGETGQMLLSTYLNRKTNWKEAGNLELFETLQPLEKKLMERLQIVEIVGKRNRKVPVLLTKDMRDAIDILVAKRSDTLANNRYLFAAPTTENGYLKGWDALKFTTANANLVRPDLITTTNMRKYVATVSQVMDLNVNTDLEWLANHMGHSISVHKNYYRLQEQTLELAKVSKLLIATDEGQAHRCAGKSLDEIRLEDIPNAVLEAEPDADDVVPESSLEAEPNADDFVPESTNADEEGYQDSDDSEDVNIETSSENSKSRKQPKRVPWSKEDTEILKRIFNPVIICNKPPTKNEVLLGVRKNTCVKTMFEARGWKSIKYYVWNLTQQYHKRKDKLLQTSSLQN